MRLWIGLVLLLTACGAPAPLTHDVEGTFTLVSADGVLHKGDGSCEGEGGYDDMTTGTQITATDQEGNIIGTSNLGAGSRGPESGGHPADDVCTFAFSFADLPDATFYSFEAGRRGAVTYSNAEMKAADWTVGLTLGE